MECFKELCHCRCSWVRVEANFLPPLLPSLLFFFVSAEQAFVQSWPLESLEIVVIWNSPDNEVKSIIITFLKNV